MKSYISIFSILLIIFFISSCDSVSSDLSGELIYSNGFNSEKEVTELGEQAWFSKEAPSGGGSGSAYISGACFIPHTSETLIANKSGLLRISAWGKEVVNSGGIELKNLRTEQRIWISISGTKWKKVKTDDFLTVQKGDTLELSMSSGGIVPGECWSHSLMLL